MSLARYTGLSTVTSTGTRRLVPGGYRLVASVTGGAEVDAAEISIDVE